MKELRAITITMIIAIISTVIVANADERPPMTESHFNELTDKDIYLIEKQRERTRNQAKWTGIEDEGWGTYNDKVSVSYTHLTLPTTPYV